MPSDWQLKTNYGKGYHPLCSKAEKEEANEWLKDMLYKYPILQYIFFGFFIFCILFIFYIFGILLIGIGAGIFLLVVWIISKVEMYIRR